MDRYEMSKNMKMAITSDIYDAVCEKRVAFVIGDRSTIFRILPVDDDTIDIWAYGIDEVPTRLVEGAGIDDIFTAVDEASDLKFFDVTFSDVLETTPMEAIAGTGLREMLIIECNLTVSVGLQNDLVKAQTELEEQRDELFNANTALSNAVQNIRSVLQEQLQGITTELDSALEDIDCEVNECSDYLE